MSWSDEIAICEALQIDWGDDADSSNRRSLQTVERYRYQAKCLMRRAGTTETPGTIGDAIDLLVAMAPTLRHSTCRQYRAALLQTLRDLYDGGKLVITRAAQYLRRLGLLDAAPLAHGSRNLPIRCGAGRRRGLSQKLRRETVLCLAESRKPMAKTLARILAIGDMVGLRPSEWANSWVQNDVLFISSAKMSDRMMRGLVPVRELNLRPLGRKCIETIKLICDDMQKNLRHYGSEEKVVARCAKLLQIHRTDPLMTLRSLRHQFRKNAQSAGWNSAQIAVAMNHRSAASQHAYGRDAKGRRGIKLPGIDHSLTISVRPARADPEARNRMSVENIAARDLVDDLDEFALALVPR